MSTHALLEAFGYVASVLVAVSLTMKSLVRLRVINLIGAAAFALYGALIHAWPVAVLNGAIAVVDAWYLWQMWSQRDYFGLLEVAHDSEYLRGFVEFHAGEIAEFIPGYTYEPDPAHVNLLVLRNMVPAGVLVVAREGAENGRVLLDFVIPGYRDFAVGRFLFDDHRSWFLDRGIRRLVSAPGRPRHAGYLARMGFRLVAGEWHYELAGKPALRAGL